MYPMTAFCIVDGTMTRRYSGAEHDFYSRERYIMKLREHLLVLLKRYDFLPFPRDYLLILFGLSLTSYLPISDLPGHQSPTCSTLRACPALPMIFLS